MSNPFYEKTKEFLKITSDYEDKGEYLKAIEVAEKTQTYIKSEMSKAQDLASKLYFENYSNVWGLYKRDLQVRNDFEVFKKEVNSSIKELKQKIRDLENKPET